MNEEKEPPVNIELGASAKAEFKAEIKGEIPSSSMGRLVDALTDAIRPFTEARGLRADQIRLQREDVLIAVAEKASQRLKKEGKTPQPVANKVLVPLLERASLEDIDDDFMLQRWAELLASAASGRQVEPRFVSILSELGGAEALLLQNIFEGKSQLSSDDHDPKILKSVRSIRGNFDANLRNFDPKIIAKDFERISELEHPLDHALAYLGVTLSGKGLIYAGFSMSNFDTIFERPPVQKRPEPSIQISMEILCSVGLLSAHNFAAEIRNYYFEGRYAQITSLGIRFLSVCSSEIRKKLEGKLMNIQNRRGQN